MTDALKRVFACWTLDETEEGGDDVEATDAEDAAERYAENYFHSYAESPKDLEVHVRDGDAVIRFDVTAEYTVNFYARKKKEPTDGG